MPIDLDKALGAELPDPVGMSRLALDHGIAGPLGRAAAALYPAG